MGETVLDESTLEAVMEQIRQQDIMDPISLANYSKLNGADDLKSWSVSIKDLLTAKSLWRYANGEKSRPQRKDGESDESFEAREDEWLAKDSKARAIIRGTVSETMQRSLMEKETAKDCWDFCNDQYKPDKLLIYRKWFELSCTNDELDFAHRFVELLQDCDSVGVTISPEAAVYHFILRRGRVPGQLSENCRRSIRLAAEKPTLPTVNDLLKLAACIDGSERELKRQQRREADGHT